MGQIDEIQADLDRIEAAVGAGNADLKALGFWRAIRPLKADPALSSRFADQAGRIDDAAFSARVAPLFPVWLGNAVLLTGVAVGAAALVVAVRSSDVLLAGIALVVSAGAWAVSVHCLAHWVVGRLAGMRFRAYFFGGPPPPRPGLKIRYETYLRTPPRSRAWMHASGAIATKLAPFVTLAFAPVTNAPAWAVWVVLVIGIFQIVTDALFSVKTSDWKRFRREMVFARSSDPS